MSFIEIQEMVLFTITIAKSYGRNFRNIRKCITTVLYTHNFQHFSFIKSRWIATSVGQQLV